MVAVRLEVATQPATIETCELCSVGPEALGEAVVIHHADGATVVLAACERCARAARRIVAMIGRDATTITADDGAVAAAAPPARPVNDLVEPPVLIHEFADQIADGQGTHFVVRAFGQPRTDGTWIGWLEFVATDAPTVLRTGTETTQPDRGALAYWASGLEAAFREGAYQRAHRRAAAPSA